MKLRRAGGRCILSTLGCDLNSLGLTITAWVSLGMVVGHVLLVGWQGVTSMSESRSPSMA